MLILTYVLSIVYIISVNVYAFTLLKNQQKSEDCCEKTRIRDGKLLFTALLGGSVGIIISSIITKHRSNSMFIMVLMPILAVLNAYMAYLFFSSGIEFLFPTTI